MTVLFIALGIAVLSLLALLLWFIPHLLHQSAMRSVSEMAGMRDMLLDILNELEDVKSKLAKIEKETLERGNPASSNDAS